MSNVIIAHAYHALIQSYISDNLKILYHLITRHECRESDRESWFRVRKTLEVC
jgi:hypothetical protein